uniref:Olfactory receptor n=1 Tax=Xenopus tropicalis TaxID=8364 RepID=A0A803K9X5_XENTR
MDITNQTDIPGFVLRVFGGSSKFHPILCLILFLCFFLTLAINLLVIIIICMDRHLHSPMYFFIASLSFMEICGISSVIFNLLAILLTNKTHISKAGCILQSYIYYFFSTSDFFILGIMSFDRYVAVCNPLKYNSIMRNSVCVKLVIGCFVTSFLCLLYPTLMITNLPFCGHMLDHFFCESAALMNLICGDITLIKLTSLITSVFILIGSLTLTATSYIIIVSTILRLSSDTGRQKTFSTCLSHLTMVGIVFGSAIFIMIRPHRRYSTQTDQVVNLDFY